MKVPGKVTIVMAALFLAAVTLAQNVVRDRTQNPDNVIFGPTNELRVLAEQADASPALAVARLGLLGQPQPPGTVRLRYLREADARLPVG